MKTILLLTIAFILLNPLMATAQYLKDKCTVRSTWYDDESGMGGGNFIIAQFEPEQESKPTIKSFKYEYADWIVTVGFHYGYSYIDSKLIPTKVNMAIMVAKRTKRKPEKTVFEAAESSLLEIDYKPSWEVEVNKNFLGKGRRYEFTLSCWDDSNTIKTVSKTPVFDI